MNGATMLPFLCSFGCSSSPSPAWCQPLALPDLGLTITLWDAAAHLISQAFSARRHHVPLPIILLYVIWSYWAFRGKVRAGHGYY